MTATFQKHHLVAVEKTNDTRPAPDEWEALVMSNIMSNPPPPGSDEAAIAAWRLKSAENLLLTIQKHEDRLGTVESRVSINEEQSRNRKDVVDRRLLDLETKIGGGPNLLVEFSKIDGRLQDLENKPKEQSDELKKRQDRWMVGVGIGGCLGLVVSVGSSLFIGVAGIAATVAITWIMAHP